MMKLLPVILSGGAGSRLWPVSREVHPKPYIRLPDGQSLLQKTFLRASQLSGVTEILTVTNRELFFRAEDEYDEVNDGQLKTTFVLEPFGRNTAAAIAAATMQVVRAHKENAILLVLPADHVINKQAAFEGAVRQALEFAAAGKLVTFGINATRPETAYGYIEADGNKVVQFVEKPTVEKARAYIASGRYVWNSGMFCFSAGAMLEQLEAHCPDIVSAMRECYINSKCSDGEHISQVDLNAELFRLVPEESIDCAVMEKSDRVAVVPCDIDWSDIGSWEALSEQIEPDENGNRVEGETLLHNTNNCYIHSNERLVAAVGVEDLLIVDTPDALLVSNKACAQDVKCIYKKLKSQGSNLHKLHRTVRRSWGSYTLLEESSQFKIKRIVVKPGASLSLQMHHHRSEHWIVVSGTARVVNGDNEFLLRTNESTYLPVGHDHRLINPGVMDLVLIEVQSGDYLGEGDIVGFQESYEHV